MKVCSDCNIEKSFDQYNKAGFYNNIQSYRSECKECRNKRYTQTGLTAKWSKNSKSKDGYNEKRNARRRLNRDTERLYESNRYKNDLLYRLKKSLRARLYSALKVTKWYKNVTFNKYIGCEMLELKQHIELKFTQGMTWENYGHGNDKWTIDHITPLSSAKTVEEMIKLCHYSNLQPMWFLDNIQKSNRLL